MLSSFFQIILIFIQLKCEYLSAGRSEFLFGVLKLQNIVTTHGEMSSKYSD